MKRWKWRFLDTFTFGVEYEGLDNVLQHNKNKRLAL